MLTAPPRPQAPTRGHWLWAPPAMWLLAMASASNGASVLERVEVVRDSTVSVRLRLSTPAHPVVHTLPADAEHPPRVYLDFPNTTVDGTAPAVVDGDTRALLRVRTARYDASTTRVVLDLSSALPYHVHQADETVTVEITPRGTAAAAPRSVAATPPAPPARAAVESIPMDAPRPVATASAPPAPAPSRAITPEPRRPVTDAAAPPTAAAPPAPSATAKAAPTGSPEPAPPSSVSPSPTAAVAPPVPDGVAAAPAPPEMANAPELALLPGMFPQAPTRREPPPAPPTRPRPGPPLALTPPIPLAVDRPLVVLDAGHGGHDPGAIGLRGVVEKEVTLDFAQRVAERLAATLPVDVVLTRADDTFLPIDARVERSAGASLFVSLHANAAENPHQRGIEVFYGGGGIQAAAAGPLSPKRLGRDVAEAIGQRLAPVTMVRPGRFAVLARNAVPSILVEVGYLTNAGDAARIADENYRDMVAQAIADGAAAFLRAPGAG